MTSVVGGGPTGTGTSGAPLGRVSENATQGLPAAEGRGAVVVVDDGASVVAVVVAVELELFPR